MHAQVEVEDGTPLRGGLPIGPERVPMDIIRAAWMTSLDITPGTLAQRRFKRVPELLQVLAHLLCTYAHASAEDVRRLACCSSLAAAERLIKDAAQSLPAGKTSKDIEAVWAALGWRPANAPVPAFKDTAIKVVCEMFGADETLLQGDGREAGRKEARYLIMALLRAHGMTPAESARAIGNREESAHIAVKSVANVIRARQTSRYQQNVLRACTILGIDPDALAHPT